MHPASHPYWTMGATVLAFCAYGFRPSRVEGFQTRVGEVVTMLLLTGAIILARNAP